MIVITQPQRFGLPRVPSTSVRCVRCEAECWLDVRAELGERDTIVCVVCAMAIVKPGDTIGAAPWALGRLEELER
jgi:hypothetical protein